MCPASLDYGFGQREWNRVVGGRIVTFGGESILAGSVDALAGGAIRSTRCEAIYENR